MQTWSSKSQFLASEFLGSFFYTNFFDYPTPNSTTCWRPLPSTIPENNTNKQHSPLWQKKTYLPNCWLEGPLFLKFLRGVVFHKPKTKIPHYELFPPFKMSKRLFKRVKPLNFMRPDFFGMWEIHGYFFQVECGVWCKMGREGDFRRFWQLGN